MKRVAAVLLAVFLVTGYATAAHDSGSHAGDSGTGAVSDTPNAGKTAAPDNTGKSEDVGKPNKTGVAKALDMVPGSSVANDVLQTISNFDPGRSLGNALAGIGEMLASPFQDGNQTVNESQTQ